MAKKKQNQHSRTNRRANNAKSKSEKHEPSKSESPSWTADEKREQILRLLSMSKAEERIVMESERISVEEFMEMERRRVLSQSVPEDSTTTTTSKSKVSGLSSKRSVVAPRSVESAPPSSSQFPRTSGVKYRLAGIDELVNQSYYSNLNRVGLLNLLRRTWSYDFMETQDFVLRQQRALLPLREAPQYSPITPRWIHDGDKDQPYVGHFEYDMKNDEIENEIIRLKSIVYKPPWLDNHGRDSHRIYDPEMSREMIKSLYTDMLKDRGRNRPFDPEELDEVQIFETNEPIRVAEDPVGSSSFSTSTGSRRRHRRESTTVVGDEANFASAPASMASTNQKVLKTLLHGTSTEMMKLGEMSNNSLNYPLLDDTMNPILDLTDGLKTRRYDNEEDLLVSPDQMMALMYLSKSIPGSGDEYRSDKPNKAFNGSLLDLAKELGISQDRISQNKLELEGGFTRNLVFMRFLQNRDKYRQSFRYIVNIAVSMDGMVSFIVPLHGLALAAAEEQTADIITTFLSNTTAIRDPDASFRQGHNYWHLTSNTMHINVNLMDYFKDLGAELELLAPHRNRPDLDAHAVHSGLTPQEVIILRDFHILTTSIYLVLYNYRRMLKPNRIVALDEKDDKKRYWHLGWKGVLKRTEKLIKAVASRQLVEVTQQFYHFRITTLYNRIILYRAANSINMPVDTFVKWIMSDLETPIHQNPLFPPSSSSSHKHKNNGVLTVDDLPEEHVQVMLRTKRDIHSIWHQHSSADDRYPAVNIMYEMEDIPTEELVRAVFTEAIDMLRRYESTVEQMVDDVIRYGRNNPCFVEVFSVFAIICHKTSRTLAYMNEPHAAEMLERVFYHGVNFKNAINNTRSYTDMGSELYWEYVPDYDATKSIVYRDQGYYVKRVNDFSPRHSFSMMFTDSGMFTTPMFLDSITTRAERSVPISAFMSWNYESGGGEVSYGSPLGPEDTVPLLGEQYEHPVWRLVLRGPQEGDVSYNVLKNGATLLIKTTDGKREAPLLQAAMAGYVVKHLAGGYTKDFSISMYWMHFMRMMMSDYLPLVKHDAWKALGLPPESTDSDFELSVRQHPDLKITPQLMAAQAQADHAHTYVTNFMVHAQGAPKLVIEASVVDNYGLDNGSQAPLQSQSIVSRHHPLVHTLRRAYQKVMVDLVVHDGGSMFYSPSFPFSYLDVFVPYDYQRLMMAANSATEQILSSSSSSSSLYENSARSMERADMLQLKISRLMSEYVEPLSLSNPLLGRDTIYSVMNPPSQTFVDDILVPRRRSVLSLGDNDSDVGMSRQYKPSIVDNDYERLWFMNNSIECVSGNKSKEIKVSDRYVAVQRDDYLRRLFDPNYSVRMQLYNVAAPEHDQTMTRNMQVYIAELVALAKDPRRGNGVPNYFQQMDRRISAFEYSHKRTR